MNDVQRTGKPDLCFFSFFICPKVEEPNKQLQSFCLLNATEAEFTIV